MTAYNLTQTVKRGETVRFDFEILDGEGEPADLSGLEEAVFAWSLYRDGAALGSKSYTDDEIEVDANTITTFLFPEDTDDFLRGQRIFYQATVTIDGLDTPVAVGDFVIEGSVGVALP